ncbi:MAG: nucleotidyltransferase domain-containing protein [Bacillota bacterium]
MSQQELLKRVIQALENTQINYMVTGSIVSSLQGEPRSKHDIDLVFAIERSAAGKLARAFPPPDFYLDEKSIVEAINQQTILDLDYLQGWAVKLDVLSLWEQIKKEAETL